MVMLACFQLPRESAFQSGADYSDLEKKGLPLTNLEAIQIYFGLLGLNFICVLFGQTSVCLEKKKRERERRISKRTV